MSSGYSFPSLSNSEILLMLKDLQLLGVPLTDAELNAPEKNAHHVRAILESLAEICTNITREEMAQPAFSGLAVLNYPDLHEDSIPQLNSLRAVGKMMEVSGIDDFSIKDLMFPTAKRLRKQFSGIINFIKFREERDALLSDQNKQRDNLLDTLSKGRRRHEELLQRLNTLKEQTAVEANIISTLEKECVNMEGTIAQLNNQQAEIREESAELKTVSNELRNALSEGTLKYDELSALRKKLSNQVVTSPAKFRKQISDVGTALQQEQQELRLAERKLRELTSWLTSIEEAEAELTFALESVLDVKSDVDKTKAQQNEVESHRNHLAVDKENLANLTQAVQSLQRNVVRSEDKLNHLRKQVHLRSHDSATAVEDMQRQVVDAESHRIQLNSRVEKIESEANRLEEELANEVAAQEGERGEIASAYQRLERLVVLHVQSLRRAMEESKSKQTNCV